MTRTIYLLATLGLLAGCAGANARSTGAGAATSAAPAPAAADYVRMAGASDLYEIQSSQAVLQTTQNGGVRDFARMMIEHHTQTTQQVAAAARAAGLAPPPPLLDAPKQAMLTELQQAQGAARDGVYVRQQLMAHQEALALHGGYAQGGDSGPLRQSASQAVPIIQQHLTALQGLQSSAGR